MVSCTLNKEIVRRLVSSWCRREPAINYLGIKAAHRVVASIRMCNPGVFAGIPFVDALFKEFGCFVKWLVADGDLLDGKDFVVATVTGCLSDILSCEKLALDILSRACGIASYGQKLVKQLSDMSWKGYLRVPSSLTPGFELVEEYAMILAGLKNIRSATCLRSHQVAASGGAKKVIDAVRSVSAPASCVEVECDDFSEAFEAAYAGADLVVIDKIPLQELDVRISKLKKSCPQVKIQLNAFIDETNLKTYALPEVDFLATSKLSNGYPFIVFQVNYDNDTVLEEEPKLLELPKSESPAAETKPQSPVDETVEAVASPTESAPKKARLGDSRSNSPKPSGTKQNGTPTPNVNQSGSPSQSGTNTPREQSHKRSQRNQRPQHNAQQRQNLPRPQGAGGLQLMQMAASRFMNPNVAASRAQLNSPQPGFNLSNQLPGVLGQQTSPNVAFRLPGQSLPQRMSPGMLGSSPNVNTGFLNMQSQQHQQQQQQQQQPQNMPQQNWSMMTGSAGQMMGGVGVGMRMGSPGHMSNCRSCGAANGPGLPFCRNCRNPLR